MKQLSLFLDLHTKARPDFCAKGSSLAQPFTLFFFAFLFLFSGKAISQNINSGDGVNFVGQINSYAQPVNGAADYRVLTYRKVSTTASNPTDGRGQWTTTVNVQASGGNVTPLNMTGTTGTGDGFLFTSGGGSGNTGTYANKWNFAGAGAAALNAVNGMQWVTTGGKDMGLNMSTAGRYTFVFKDAGYTTSGFYVGYTAAAPVTVSHTVATQQTVALDRSATIGITTSATPSTGELVFLRYRVGTNDFSASTNIVQATGSGTSWSAAIPAQAFGSTVYYYVFTSTRTLAQINAHSEGDRSYIAMRYADNAGSNYSYSLPQTFTSAQTGNWSAASTWTQGRIPFDGADVTVQNGHTVTIDQSVNGGTVTINQGGTITHNNNSFSFGNTTNITTLTVNGQLTLGSALVTPPCLKATTLTVGSTGTFTNNAGKADVVTVTNFNVNSGGTYNHNAVGSGTAGSVTDFPGTAWTFGATSNTNITFWGVSNQGPPALPSLSWGHLNFTPTTTWSGSLQMSGGLSSVQGNLTIGATGGTTREFRLTTTSTSTLAIGGNFTVSGGIVNGKSGNNGSVTINLTGDLSVSGGTFNMSNGGNNNSNCTINMQGNFAVSSTGILTHTDGTCTINFIKASGTQTASTTATGIIGGDIVYVVGNGTTTNTVQLNSNFPMNAGSSITVSNNAKLFCAANIITGGTCAVAAGGTLGIGSADGIATTGTGAFGNVQTSTRTLPGTGHYIYNGTGNQFTGTALPATLTTGTLTIANTGTSPNNVVTLTQNTTENATLNLLSGAFDLNAKTFTMSATAAQSIAGSGSNTFNITGAAGSIFALSGGTSHAVTLSAFGTGTSANLITGANVNVQLNATTQLDCAGNGTSTSMLTVLGTFTMNSASSSFIANVHPPFYGTGSTLAYAVTYGRSNEWNATSGPGYPYNVTVASGATLDVKNGVDSYKKLGGKLTVNGTFNLNGLTADLSGNGICVEALGDIENNGTISFTASTKRLKGVNLVNGNLNTTAIVNLSTVIGGDLELTGNYVDNAVFNANARAVFFTGSGVQDISGTATAPFNIDYIVVTKPSGSVRLLVDLLTGAPNTGNALVLSTTTDILDLNGKTFTLGTSGVASAITGNGFIKGSTTSNLILNGTGAFGTVRFDQTTPGTTNALQNLTVNRTATGSMTLGNNLSVGGALALTNGSLVVSNGSAATLSIGGTLTRTAGAIDDSSANATVAFTNASSITLPASVFTGTVNNITMNGAGGIIIPADFTISGTLQFLAGKITTNANKVIIPSGASVSGGGSGWVIGNLQKNVPTGTNSRTFEVGDASNYTPVTTAYTGVTTAGDLVVKATAGDHPQVSGSGVNASASVNRYYALTNSGIAGGSYDGTFTFVSGDVDGGANTANFVVRRYVNPTWFTTTVGTKTSTTTQATGLTAYGDFQLGELNTLAVAINPANSSVCPTAGASFNSTSTSTPAPAVSWERGISGVYAPVTGVLDGGVYSGFNSNTLTISNASGLNGYTYRAVFTNINGSVTSTAATLSHNAISTAAAISGTTSVCPGNSTNIQVAITGGVSPYTVVYTDGTSNFNANSYTSGSNISVTPTSASTTYTIVSVTSANGCPGTGNTGNAVISWYSPSTASVISGSTGSCPGSTVNIAVAITAGTGPYSVTYTDGTSNFNVPGYTSGSNISVSPSATTTYSLVSVTDANGCSGTGLSGSAVVTISSTTWNGSAWSNGTPSSTKAVVFAGNYTAAADINACSITVNSGTIDIPSGFNVTLNGALTVSGGSFTLENNANLLQNTTVSNSGNIIVKRNSSPVFRQDYTMWSSPVSTQQLQAFSPLTLSNRFYTFDAATNLYVATSATGNFGNGLGYLIRVRNDWVPYIDGSSVAVSWPGAFTGVAHNGNYSPGISDAGPGGENNRGFNAVGNPYPSAIRLDDVINNNSSNIEGTLWFWRKRNDTNNLTSYSTCTTVGCTINNGHTYADDNYISTGQGFIVKAQVGATAMNFTNSMRAANNTNQFFRTDVMDRFWLEVKNSADTAFGINLIAYVPEATLGYDSGKDGLFLNDNPTALYSMADDRQVVIQARPSFVTTDVVPMVFQTNIADTYSIGLQQSEGVFATQDIFIKDNATNTVHNLRTSPYTFAIEPGTTTGRFEVIYDAALATTNPLFGDNSVVVYKQNTEVVVNAGKQQIAKVQAFDIRGRLLFDKDHVNATETRFSVGTTNQVLIVKVTSVTGAIVTKKIVN